MKTIERVLEDVRRQRRVAPRLGPRQAAPARSQRPFFESHWQSPVILSDLNNKSKSSQVDSTQQNMNGMGPVCRSFLCAGFKDIYHGINGFSSLWMSQTKPVIV